MNLKNRSLIVSLLKKGWTLLMLYSSNKVSLITLLALDTLISPSGKILIPGIREAVAPLSDEEWKMYQDIEFDIDNYKNKIGVNQLMYSNRVRVQS